MIGAGVVGLCAARRLARDGRRVVLLDRAAQPGAASRAAAGMLAPQAEAIEPGPFFDLLREARDVYPAFVAEVEAETGRGVDWRRDGLLALEGDLAAETELARHAEWQRAAGLAVEELGPSEVASRWPELELPRLVALPDEPAAEGRVFHFPDEAQVDAERLSEALVAACARAGVDVRLGRAVLGLLRAADAVAGVVVAGGDVASPLVVNAAGAWAGAVASWAGESLPIEPVRGEMVAYPFGGRPPWPIVVSSGAYCLLREDERLLVGATVERAGYDAAVTDAGQAWLEERAARLAPSTARARPAGRWAGLRPGTPDGWPVLGASTELEGLFHLTGHFRNGILLAPLTGELLAGIVAGDADSVAKAAPFGPGRVAAASGTA